VDILDPVAAYNRIAPEYGRISDRRRLYLDRVEELVIHEVPRSSRSLLDIGAADGRRAAHIASACGLSEITLLEPSMEMRETWPATVRSWAMRAEELPAAAGSFDVITCLWNVLGHVFPAANRIEVLRQSARLLAPEGVMFVDLNHRYNARHYGMLPTIARIIRDYIFPGERNGDVVAKWTVGRTTYRTRGHVFTHGEFRSLAFGSGLRIRKVFVVDYETGGLHGSRFSGNLLYTLEHASSSTRHTSAISCSASELKNGNARVLDETCSVTGNMNPRSS